MLIHIVFDKQAIWHQELFDCGQSSGIDPIGYLNVVRNSELWALRFFVYCICIIMWHSHLNDMGISETKRFIPKGFELGQH